MKPLYSNDEFTKATANDNLLCQCYNCEKPFQIQKKAINRIIKHKLNWGKFCSHYCFAKSKEQNTEVPCMNCGKLFKKKTRELRRIKNKKNFCSQSCSATYNNTHKTYGVRRSKLEVYLEEQLMAFYPNLRIDFNKKDAINSELDIYISSLNLAFELNGIFHYKPIHGEERLKQIKSNDEKKNQTCLERKIELITIDVSSMSYFKKERANKFLKIILKIINSKINNL